MAVWAIWWHRLYNHEFGAGFSDCLVMRDHVWLHATYDYMQARGYEDGAELIGLFDSTQNDHLFHMM